MNQKKKFNILLAKISHALIDKIQQEDNLSFLDATISLYSSKLYKMLSDESTKVWHFSVCQLYDIYKDEKETGVLDFEKKVEHNSFYDKQAKAFCISVLEKYKDIYGMEGESALKLFMDYNIFNFLDHHFGTLHMQSLENTCQDVKNYIETRHKAKEIGFR